MPPRSDDRGVPERLCITHTRRQGVAIMAMPFGHRLDDGGQIGDYVSPSPSFVSWQVPCVCLSIAVNAPSREP